MKTSVKTITIMLLVCLLGLLLLTACGGGRKKTPASTAQPTLTSTVTPAKKVVITIGNLTDFTGVAAVPMQSVNDGLQDIVKYYNDNNLIPGVKVKLVQYDSQADPSRDIPGWEWLKEKRAVAIMAWLPGEGITLQPLANKDRIPLFVTMAPSELLKTPGYMFLTAPRTEDLNWDLIKWVMENDWDYATKGPAKVGAASWVSDNPDPKWAQFKKYATMYPERMTWEGGQIAPNSTFDWSFEVEALKDCDYIMVPNLFGSFVRSYVTAGYDKAKFLGTDTSIASFKLIGEMGLWPKIDGMIFITQSEWWTDNAEYPNFAKELVQKYRPGSLKELEESGKGYFSIINGMLVLEAIKNAAAAAGPENVDAQAIYEGAQSVKLTFDGLERFSFSKTKQVAPDRLAIYKANGAAKSLVKVSDWFPIESPPE